MVLTKLRVCSSLGFSSQLTTSTSAKDRSCGRATARSFLGPLAQINHPREASLSLQDSSLGLRFSKMEKQRSTCKYPGVVTKWLHLSCANEASNKGRKNKRWLLGDTGKLCFYLL